MSKQIVSYSHFEDEFIGMTKHVWKEHDGDYSTALKGVTIRYDIQMDEFYVYKNGEVIQTGLDLKTAKLIMKVLK